MDALFKEFAIYASQGQRYEPVDHALLLTYKESQSGQILEEGITEAGSMASFIAAGTSYAHQSVPMVPFFTFYSMFGFQRSEARRVGKEGVLTCRSRGWRYH